MIEFFKEAYKFVRFICTPCMPMEEIQLRILLYLKNNGERSTLDIYDSFEMPDFDNPKPYTHAPLSWVIFILGHLEEEGVVISRDIPRQPKNARYPTMTVWKLTGRPSREKVTHIPLFAPVFHPGIS